jgi:hypothetical protein
MVCEDNSNLSPSFELLFVSCCTCYLSSSNLNYLIHPATCFPRGYLAQDSGHHERQFRAVNTAIDFYSTTAAPTNIPN